MDRDGDMVCIPGTASFTTCVSIGEKLAEANAVSSQQQQQQQCNRL
jgi:hypothetical protein